MVIFRRYRAARKTTVSVNDQVVLTLDDLAAECFDHAMHGFEAVALLQSETRGVVNVRFAVCARCKHCEDRNEIGDLRGIDLDALERRG